MPLVDDVTAPIDPEDVDETYDSAPDGGLKPRFDVPWYVFLTASRSAAHGAGSYGLKIPWFTTEAVGEPVEYKGLNFVQGIPASDTRTTKGVLTPETAGSSAYLHGGGFWPITMSDNRQDGLDELMIDSTRSVNSDYLMPGPSFPERVPMMYRVPREGGVDQTMVVAAAEDVVLTGSDAFAMTISGEQAVGLSALSRAKTKIAGAQAWGRAEGIYFELVVQGPADGFGGVPGSPLTFDKWRLVAVTDAQDETSGKTVLATSTENLPTKVGERRAMTLRCKDGIATCYVDGVEVMSKPIPATLTTGEYTAPGPAQQAWFHAGPGNMYVGPHTYVKSPEGALTHTTYRGNVRWYTDLYVVHRSGHMGTVWTSHPNSKKFPLVPADGTVTATLPASRFGQPPIVLTSAPEGAAMGRMGVRATATLNGPSTYRTHWQPETPLPTEPTEVYSPDLHATFNGASGNGTLMAVLPAEYNVPENDDVPANGLVVRGRAKAKTFLMVEVFNNGGIKWPGSSPEIRSHMVKLWAYKADGTRTLLKAASVLPPLEYDYKNDNIYADVRARFGGIGSAVYSGTQVHVKTVGSSVKVYLTTRANYGYLGRPTLILQHTLDGADATTYGPEATMVGLSTMANSMYTRSGGPAMALTFITKDPIEIVKDPPQVITDPTDEPTDVGDGDDTQVDTTIPPGGETTIKNGDDDDDTGTEVTTDRDDDDKVKTIITIKNPPDGPDIVIKVPDYDDANPGDPLRFRVQWINGKIIIWFNGKIWFTYTLTPTDLSKLGTSRKYLSFWQGGVRVAPPAGTTIIRGQWTPTSLTMMVVVPTKSLGVGAAKDRLWGRLPSSTPQVLIVGADESVLLTDEPDDEWLADALYVFGGGRATNNVVPPEVANIIGAAGYGDLLHTIES